jgi:CRP-like cAMP-binding protein
MTTILLIEDDADLSNIVERILKLSHYNVVKSNNGSEALEILNLPSFKCGLILCDVTLLEIDGYALLQATRNIQAHKNTPFIFISGKVGQADIRKGMNLGADDYLGKPFSADDLLSTVSSRLEKAKTARDNWENLLEFESLIRDNSGLHEENEQKYFRRKILQKKDILFSEGDPAINIYYVVKGQLRISVVNDFGKEFISNIFSKGDFLAYNGLFHSTCHDGTAVANERSEVLVFRKEDFITLLTASKNVCGLFTKFLCTLLVETECRLPKMVYDSARRRVADAILMIQKKHKDEKVSCNSFPITRDVISAISGVTPETTSRNLSDFRGEKLIDFARGEMIVLDTKGLAEVKN